MGASWAQGQVWPCSKRWRSPPEQSGQRAAAMGSPSPADAVCFAQLLDTPLHAEACLCAWCPTMDICALVLDDGQQLQLHRLNWQLLWMASPEALITAICWSPDGRQLAAGHQDGSVSIYDVESGEVRTHHAGPATSGPGSQIVSIAWTAQQDNQTTTGMATVAVHQQQVLSSYKSRHKRLFAPPPIHDPSSIPSGPNSNTPPDPYPALFPDTSNQGVCAAVSPSTCDDVSAASGAEATWICDHCNVWGLGCYRRTGKHSRQSQAAHTWNKVSKSACCIQLLSGSSRRDFSC